MTQTQKQDRKKMYEELAYGFPSRAKKQQLEKKFSVDDKNPTSINEIVSSDENLIVPPADFKANVEKNIPVHDSIYPPRKSIHQKLKEEAPLHKEQISSLLSEDVMRLDSFEELDDTKTYTPVMAETSACVQKVQKTEEKTEFPMQSVDGFAAFKLDAPEFLDMEGLLASEKSTAQLNVGTSADEKKEDEPYAKPFFPVEQTEELFAALNLNADSIDAPKAVTSSEVEPPILEMEQKQMESSIESASTFMPRGLVKRKSRHAYFGRKKGKKSVSWAFLLSVLFALIVVIVLVVGSLYLNRDKDGSVQEQLPLEPVQIKNNSEDGENQTDAKTNAQNHLVTSPTENETETSQTTHGQEEIQVVDGVEYRIMKHTVKNNENLASISKQYFGTNVGIDLIYQWNQLESAVLSKGQILEVPIPIQ